MCVIIFKYISELFKDFVSLLFPKICIHCGTPLVYQEEHLCTACRIDLPKTNYHLQKDNPMEQKFVFEPKIGGAAAYLHYHRKGVAQSMIHHLKYKGYQELGVQLGKWYGAELLESNWKIDLIIPVPLHVTKQSRRGYNQSELIARGIAEALNTPYQNHLVIRQQKTKTQTRKSKVKRLENVNAIYRIQDAGAFEAKNVLLIDDVITTGATIGELAGLIARETDVRSIYVAAIAGGK